MENNASEIARLLLDQQSGTLSPVDRDKLEKWLQQSSENRLLAKNVEDPSYLFEQLQRYQAIDIPPPEYLLKKQTTPLLVPIKRSISKWIAYAAAVAIVVSSALLVWKYQQNIIPTKDNFVQVDDIYTSKDQVIITLEDGTSLPLDQSESAIVVNDNRIAYADGSPLLDNDVLHGKPLWMTLSTPTGSTYAITLDDGTKVLLNASSSLRYPNKFAGRDRVVELTGEAYFEVSRDHGKPFKVRSGKQEIEVLGTQFNAVAYPDEQTWRTTLVEGKVKVHNTMSGKQQTLIPSQQAVLKGDEIYKHTVTIESEVAWMSGKFSFDGKSFDQIMKEMGRWYGFEVIYETNKPQNRLIGDAFRTDNLRAVLRLLNNSAIQYRMEKNDNGQQRLIISKRKEATN